MRSAPSQVVLYSRRPQTNVTLAPGRLSFANFGEDINVVDAETGLVRPSTIANVAPAALLVDALPSISIYERAVVASDVPVETATLRQANAWLGNTAKPGIMGFREPLHLTQAIGVGLMRGRRFGRVAA